MALRSSIHTGDRKTILRDVYEDNLRTSRQRHRRTRRTRRLDDEGRRELPPVIDKAPWILGLVVVLVTALNVTIHETPVSTELSATDQAVLPMKLTAPGAPVSVPEPPLSVADLYGLHVRTIVIDPGHGGRDPGATGRHGLQEKEITLDVARRLQNRLQSRSGYRILLTRDGDETMELRERIEFANQNDADLFISLHVNWLPVDSIAPIETYYYGPESDARAVRLARRENRNSGYSVAEFNEFTHQLGLELKIQESRQAAHSIQGGLIESLRRLGNGVSDWGAKSGDFMVLLGVQAPSVLAEIGSLSNGDDEVRLGTVSYRETLAYILEEGLVNYLGSHAHENKHLEHGSEEDSEGL